MRVIRPSLPGVSFAALPETALGDLPMFSKVRRGRRTLHHRTALPALQGWQLWYSGPHLDVADQFTLESAFSLCGVLPAGEPVHISKPSLARRMGRSSVSLAWLRSSLRRLALGRILYDSPEEEGISLLLGLQAFKKNERIFIFSVPEVTMKAFGRMILQGQGH